MNRRPIWREDTTLLLCVLIACLSFLLRGCALPQ